MVKESACNVGDLGLIPGLGRTPREGNGYPLQYSGLKKSMDCIVLGVTKSWRQLSNFIREIQIKTTMSYHLTTVRMGIIKKKSTNNKCWRECGEKGIDLHCCWECKLIQPLWKTVWRFHKKLGMKLPSDLTVPLLGIYPVKIIIEKAICTPVFTAALFTTARMWKQPRCPSRDEWEKKL